MGRPFALLALFGVIHELSHVLWCSGPMGRMVWEKSSRPMNVRKDEMPPTIAQLHTYSRLRQALPTNPMLLLRNCTLVLAALVAVRMVPIK